MLKAPTRKFSACFALKRGESAVSGDYEKSTLAPVLLAPILDAMPVDAFAFDGAAFQDRLLLEAKK